VSTECEVGAGTEREDAVGTEEGKRRSAGWAETGEERGQLQGEGAE
jgi:hypothetical protein